jgi:hypothetical protein
MHVALGAWIAVDITHPSVVTKQTVGIGVLFATLWTLLFITRRSSNRPIAGHKDAQKAQ